MDKMDKYEQFRKMVDGFPAGAPESPYFTEILHIMFSDEDIDILLHMNYVGKTAEEIAFSCSKPLEQVYNRLEAMAKRGAIFLRDKDERRLYAILPTIPGMFEIAFMKGIDETPDHERLAKLWDEYKHDAQGKGFAGNPTPLQRVIPVERSLDSKNQVFSYDEVAGIIRDAEYIAVTNCACRIAMRRCDKASDDICLVFGNMARFLVKVGRAKEVSKENAMKVLDRADKEGLVHTRQNSQEETVVICNCCSCCCTILRGRLELGLKNTFEPSRFVASVDNSACIACKNCINKRCPAKAIEEKEDGTLNVNPENCIGCGLCVSGCPVKAMRMIPRDEQIETPVTSKEMIFKVLKEKGKLENFMANFKK